MSRYIEGIRSRIEQHKRYPRSARLKRLQGRVTLAFELFPDGGVGSLRVLGAVPDPDPVLAQAALDAVRSAGRFEPIPAELGRSVLQLEIPVQFRLE